MTEVLKIWHDLCAYLKWNWNFDTLIDKFKMVYILTHDAFYTENVTEIWVRQQS